jgi:hypothetical protein
MPKKAKPETPAEQSARFVRETEALIAAGDLSPIDADAGLDGALRGVRLDLKKDKE